MKTQKFLLSLLGLGVAAAGYAQTFTWSGADSGARWNIDANWAEAGRPGDASNPWGNTIDLIWNTSGAGNLNAVLGAQNPEFRSLTFNDNVLSDVTIGLQRIVSTTASDARNITFVSNSGPASLTVNSDATANILIDGGRTGFGDMILGSALAVTNNGSGLLSLDARITGSNGITFSGSGTTRLGAANTFTGTLNLNGGLVQFEANNRLGNAANALVFDGGGLQFIGTAANNLGAGANIRDLTINAGGATIDIATDRLLTLNNEITGTGDLTVTRSGDPGGRVLLANADNSWSGNLNITDGGQVDFNNRDALGALSKTITLNNGTLRMIDASTQNLHANTTISVGANGGELNASNASGVLVVRGNIGGTGLLTTDGSGVVDLTVSANNWSGGLRVAGGTTRINNINQIGSGNITLAGGALEDTSTDGLTTGVARTVTVDSASTIRVTNSAANHRINGLLAGSGDLTVTGGGRVTPSGESNTFSGNWLVTGGSSLSVATAGAGSNVRLGSGANLDLDNGTLNFSGSEGGAINTHTRNTVLGAGGGTFQLGNAANQNPTITWNGDISGTGDLTVSNAGGTSSNFILGGAVTHLGDTTIEAGSTMTLANGGSMTFVIGANNVNNGLLGDGTVNLDGQFIFDLTGAAAVGSWTLVAGTLTENFGGTFSVKDFTNNGGVWTFGDYTFDESTGVLTAVPEPATYALIGGLLALGAVLIRRRMK